MLPHASTPDLHGYESAVRRAKAAGNRSVTLQFARGGVAAARKADNERALWQFTFEVADAHLAMDAYAELREVADGMLSLPAARQDAVLQVRSLILRSIAERCLGQESAAIATADEALALTGALPGHDALRAEVLQTLIAGLVEADRAHEAWRHHMDLACLLESMDNQSAGKGFWTLGNVAFMVGSVQDGLSYHAQAAELLSPANDIPLWARFNKASADLQLRAGIAIEQTRDCIERASLAHEVMDATEVDRVGLAVTNARWNVARERPEEADRILADALSGLADPNAAHLVPAYHLWAEVLDTVRPDDAPAKRATANRIQRLTG
ncbi:hypothetical protein [Arthrobacter sp. KK5.5]|uniref:hypothetical protein n=1 Tax=Arthrobacter sp. KK5.5 TaxID=3373084 RepID=UPI003EE67491